MTHLPQSIRGSTPWLTLNNIITIYIFITTIIIIIPIIINKIIIIIIIILSSHLLSCGAFSMIEDKVKLVHGSMWRHNLMLMIINMIAIDIIMVLQPCHGKDDDQFSIL